MPHPAIIVHGGAGDIPDEHATGHRRGVQRASQVGWEILVAGGSAEDAVEAAIRVLEDDEVFDAGRGSFLDLDGALSMDAAFMEGTHLEAGAVAAVSEIRNPITLARLLVPAPHVLLVGEGAHRWAEQQGLPRCSPDDLIVPRERERVRAHQGAHDTVGAVALDRRGHLAAGVSTGGSPLKVPGRVGDVPCIGAGLYADDLVGGVSCTGVGEKITRIVMAKRCIDRMARGDVTPQQAAEEAIAYLAQRVQGQGGLIILSPDGQVGCAMNTPRMSRAWITPDGAHVGLDPTD